MSNSSIPKEISERYRFLKDYDIKTECRDILDNLEHEVYVVDTTYSIVFANYKAQERFGKDIIENKCKQVRSRKKPHEHCVHCPVVEVFSGKILGYIGNLEAVDKNGDTHYYSETATPLYDNSGNISLAVLICRDMTKRHDIENVIKKFPKVQQDFLQYRQYASYVVDELQKVGYNRIRFYHVVNDKIRDDKLLVMRESYGMNDMHKNWINKSNPSGQGYRFYLKDPGYRHLLIDGIKDPKLFKYEEVIKKYPDYKCIDDLEFKNISWLNLPMVVEDELIALLSLDNKGKDDVCNEDLTLLTEFAEYFSQALNAFRAEMNLRHLDHINKLINERRHEGDILEIVAREVCERIQAGMCGIILYSDSEKGGKLIWSAKEEEDSEQSYQGIIENDKNLKSVSQGIKDLFSEGEPINLIDIPGLIDDNSIDFDIKTIDDNILSRFQNAFVKETGRKYKIKNVVIAPLIFEDVTIGFIGLMNNLWDSRYPFPDSEVELLGSIASQIAVAAQHDRMRAEIDIAIVDITESISNTDYKVDEVAKEIVKTIKKVSKAKVTSLLLVDEDKQCLETIALEGIPGFELNQLRYDLNTKKSRGFGIPVWVKKENKAFIANSRKEIENCDAFGETFDKIIRNNDEMTCSLLAIPLRFNNEVIGVLRIDDPQSNKFTKSIQNLCFTLANFAAVAISSAQEIERREDFFISSNHELGMPITGLTALGEVVKKRYLDGMDIEDLEGIENSEYIKVKRKTLIRHCEDLFKETQHLHYLINGNLALDKEVKFDFKEYNLIRVIGEVKSVLAISAKRKFVDIQFNYDSILGKHIFMDKEKLKQAFYNVIMNALKYTVENDIIEINVIRKDKNFIITILDHGIGINPEHTEIIFNKGFRSINAQEIEPSGLGKGLFFAKIIIEGHRGSIKVTKFEDPTEFTIILPVKQEGNK